MSDDGGSGDGVGASTRAGARAVAASPTNRLLAYAALLTAVVAALAGVASSFTHYFPLGTSLYPLDPGQSGAATLATQQVARASFWTVAGLYVVLPVAVGGYLAARGDRHWLASLSWAAVAVLGVPWLGYVALSLATTMPDAPVLVALVAGPALVALALGVAAARGPTDAPRRPSPAVFLNLAVVVVFLLGVAVGGLVAAPLSGLLQEESLSAPTAAWDFVYESTGDGRAVLTVTHDGGDKVEAEHLHVGGSGFADVPGVNQTAPGRWQGATAGDVETGGTVEAGDSVTVGVTTDCEIRLVYEHDEAVQTIGFYECPGAGGEDGSAGTRPSSIPGGW